MIIFRVIHQLIEELNTLKGCYRMLVNEGIEDDMLRNSIYTIEQVINDLKNHPKAQEEINGITNKDIPQTIEGR